MFLISAAAFALSNYGAGWLLVATGGLIAHWLADQVDGDLARARGLTSPRGLYLDLLYDNVGTGLITIGLGLSPYATFSIVALGYIFYATSGVVSFLSMVLVHEFPIFELGPSEAEIGIATVAAVTFLLGGPCVVDVASTCLSLFDIGALVLMWVPAYFAVRLAIDLYRRLPGPRQP